jgi:putative IMPACT (imprinted ancient) family translation regulator
VVRYFGGTKLGVSGLIQAYRTAADEALSNAEIIRRELTANGKLNYPYSSTTEVQRLIKDFDLTIQRQEFGEACLLNFQIKQSILELFLEKVELLRSTGTVLTLDLEKK